MDKGLSDKLAISVILPVYNGGEFLYEAIESILNQTLKNLELIIVNDGSTDESLSLIKSFNDSRIILISRKNKGLVASLNEMIDKSNADIIARQDADDISEPTRLQKQYDYLRNNPDVVAIGSSISTMDMAGKIINEHAVISGKRAVKSELLVRSPFAHGSVMMRKKALVSASK
jgi:glycosyltransferase involved in cell wall biosynthesis